MYDCPICHGRGLIVLGDYAAPCKCMKQYSLAKKFKNAHLTPKMKQYTFANFNFKYYARNKFDEERKTSYYNSAVLAYRAAQRFVDSFLENPHTEGLLFTGDVGSGKTFLACCIANALLDKGKEVLFLVVPDLLDEIRATYHENYDGVFREQDLIDSARNAPVLILDDLGAHNYTDWARNKLYSILNHRLNHLLPTIITTNIGLADLSFQYLGERTTSRIFEMCRPYRLLVEMDIRIVQRQASEKN